ncbi:bifunctional 2-C-methyl-D-erythritol 4-phosphate cytidylyltransferase/2-C-methyl-D-erythritol 2,4-cyclodiphosphate synthase [uncultured Devosia sp.]|uniref:bifunctional 2-C-methyl-D-erythritol 4-phosphate cytidylyltransferase/2-C-methyl-D-erythritol 2,4-cyclodiphosphate synthase n=1 Tax=uncultured Devosia sp. TaxID=211434 RepID=UPI0035CA7D5E
MPPSTIAVIVVAAGRGERVNIDGATEPKQYRALAGTPVLTRTIRAFLDYPHLAHVLPVINPDHSQLYADLNLDDPRLLPPVFGGESRQASVLAGLKALAPHRPDLVLIQDAARPFAFAELIGDVIAVLERYDGSLPALAISDTVKRSGDGRLISGTEDRSQLFAAQTPQGFRFEQILAAHLRAAGERRQFTDDAEIAEWAGLTVAMVIGSEHNMKLTYASDFERAERIVMGNNIMETRIGTGYDVHPFEPGDAVWLGGVRIPHTAGLQGHSDADVALHALTDAVLGAIGEGDIGTHFPPSDMQWKSAASSIFLKHAGFLVGKAGGRIVNLDVTIIAERPRIAEHVPAMRIVIGEALGIEPSRIAIKATTSEKLGFVGREEGIVAMASASVELPRQS